MVSRIAMRHLAAVVLPVALAVLGGCQSEPARIQPALHASPRLLAASPADIAVLPVEDATPDRRAEPVLVTMREANNQELVERRYSPLAAGRVDAALGTGGSNRRGGVIDAAWLGSLAGKAQEDALLGIRVTRWDTSSLMANARVRFAADVTMIDSKTKETLWSGNVDGDVKAGGDGAAPLDPAERARDAARRFGHELIQLLPRRRL
jgi:hypothetical protein